MSKDPLMKLIEILDQNGFEVREMKEEKRVTLNHENRYLEEMFVSIQLVIKNSNC